jgi:diguanylate cyclase (GGDEF)-like protein
VIAPATHPPRASLWSRIWRPPDPQLADAGTSGELLVARIRVAVVCLLFTIPLVNVLDDPGSREAYVGLWTALAALAISVTVLLALQRGVYRPWLGFATSALDVSVVSGALSVFVILGQPHTAVNSKVIFEAYFLAIFATSLRYDPRICVVVGLTALTQYAAIVGFSAIRWDLNDPRYAPFPYGMFSWNAQIGRFILLLAAALLSSTVVIRARRLRRLSASDRLTGLLRRGAFDDRLLEEAARAQRSGRPLSMAMIDVDHFKPFNDAHGHEAGDGALRAVAAALRQSVRESDIVARYGGEEFVIILPETEPPDALARMEEIRQLIASTPIVLPRHAALGPLTVSIGVASWPHDGQPIDEVLARADARLFEAKQLGRNRIVGTPSEAAVRVDGISTRVR